MSAWTGFFSKSGSPCLKLTLRGVFGNKQEFEAVIDTGFSGFVSIPLLKAFPLGLVLVGITSVVLADGSTTYRLMALCEASVGGEEGIDVAILEPKSQEVLVGMQFLTRLKKRLTVCPGLNVVEVADDIG